MDVMQYQQQEKKGLQIIIINADLSWVGLEMTSGRWSATLSKIFSLAPNYQFTHIDFTLGGVIPEKVSTVTCVQCTGEFTQTGVTLI